MFSFASTSAEWNRGVSHKFAEWSRLVLALDIRLLPGYPFRLHNAQRIPEERSEGHEKRFVQRIGKLAPAKRGIYKTCYE